MWFYVFMYDSWCHKVLKWFIIVHIGSVSSFLKFGGQTSKNVHDVRKVCLETTLRVYLCFIEFYMFVLDETHVVCPKLVYEHIWVGKVWVRLHIGPTRGPTRGPQHWSSTLPSSGNRRPKRWPVDQETARRWVSLMEPLGLQVEELQVQPMRPSLTGRGWDHGPSMLALMGCVFSCQLSVKLRGEVVNSHQAPINLWTVVLSIYGYFKSISVIKLSL